MPLSHQLDSKFISSKSYHSQAKLTEPDASEVWGILPPFLRQGASVKQELPQLADSCGSVKEVTELQVTDKYECIYGKVRLCEGHQTVHTNRSHMAQLEGIQTSLGFVLPSGTGDIYCSMISL